MESRGVLDLPDNDEMFSKGACGQAKSQLALKLMERYGTSSARLSGNEQAAEPFHVFTTSKSHTAFLRSGGMYVKILDALMFMQVEPLQWNDEAPGDLKNLARSLLLKFCRHATHGTTLLVLCIDCAAHITWRREIQHRKRGKVQANEAVQEAMLGGRAGECPLSDLGGFQAIMKSKLGGLPRLVDEMAWQARNPNTDENWDLSDHLPKHTSLAIVGGSTSIPCVVSVRDNRVVLAGHVDTAGTFSQTQVSNNLTGVEKQGEGEAMMFLVVRRLLSLQAGHCVDAASNMQFELTCADVDALGARAMPELYRLSHMCTGLGFGVTNLRLYLTMHPKSGKVLRQLGVLVHGRLPGSRHQARADARFLTTMADLFALRDAIENDEQATGGVLFFGLRSIAATTAILAFTNNDMLQALAGGMGVGPMFDAFFSDEFNDLACRFGNLVSLVKSNDGNETFSLSYPGMLPARAVNMVWCGVVLHVVSQPHPLVVVAVVVVVVVVVVTVVVVTGGSWGVVVVAVMVVEVVVGSWLGLVLVVGKVGGGDW